MKTKFLRAFALFAAVFSFICTARAGDNEFIGQFESTLIANTDDMERVVLKAVSPEQIKGLMSFPEGTHLAGGRLVDPRTQKFSILSLLVESPGKDPMLILDSNADNKISSDEMIALKRAANNNPYIWEGGAIITVDKGAFKSLPIFVRYLRSVKTDKMGPDDRLVMQSTMMMARGSVDVNGKNVVFQLSYNPEKGNIDPRNGWIGADIDGDGMVDIDKLSPESTFAKDENVVFRSGSIYVSVKKVDLDKNQFVVRQNQEKEYKRAELFAGKEFPAFSFTDFDNKKHSISDYRGKFVLLDIWGFWCPACREELPYLREANKRFQSRGLVVLGLNTDENYTVDSMKSGLNKSGMNWTHAQFSSVAEFIATNLRIHTFPTTFLISPEGKIISMSRTSRKEHDLRGRELLDTLDEILPAM